MLANSTLLRSFLLIAFHGQMNVLSLFDFYTINF